MVQGKFKKSKLPANLLKQKQQQAKKQAGKAFTRRSNAPIQAKKNKFNENQKIKEVISKTVNKSVESELRARATEGHIKLSGAQKAVAKHHQTTLPESSTSTGTNPTT